MPSLWGCTELLCVLEKCSFPFRWQVRPVAESQDYSIKGEGSKSGGLQPGTEQAD